MATWDKCWMAWECEVAPGHVQWEWCTRPLGHGGRHGRASKIPAEQVRNTGEVFHEAVSAERARHVANGYDTAHDDEHGPDHLLEWALDYLGRGEPVKAGALIVAAREALARSHGERHEDAQVEAFKREWAQADGEGDTGNRVRRGLRAARAVTDQSIGGRDE